MDAVLTLTDAPTAEQQRVIGSGLAKFNAEQAGYSDSRDLAILVSDPATQQVVGGLLGRTSLGILFVDLFYVHDALRGQQLGSRSWRPQRTKRGRRGCSAAVLYTISFQAPGFYERHGYRAFGTIGYDPPGTSRVFMTKPLK
jgi:GNAT superfamily N-acetyltransferase